MGNKYVQASLVESRKGESITFGYSDCDYLDVDALSGYLRRLCVIELKDESFDFDEFGKMTAKIYRLFITLDILGGGVNKKMVHFFLNMKEFISRKTSEKGISLIQSLLKLMLVQFLGDVLTAKPSDVETHERIVFDEDDAGKEYSDKYFSFGHNGKRYTVKTDTFDLSSILDEL